MCHEITRALTLCLKTCSPKTLQLFNLAGIEILCRRKLDGGVHVYCRSHGPRTTTRKTIYIMYEAVARENLRGNKKSKCMRMLRLVLWDVLRLEDRCNLCISTAISTSVMEALFFFLYVGWCVLLLNDHRRNAARKCVGFLDHGMNEYSFDDDSKTGSRTLADRTSRGRIDVVFPDYIIHHRTATASG
ncbi:hypothetical protein BS17DRAFT_258433 [Gyrodon lividus]|nr:hypothetical protein BS17DRAFT_258433 [Gyrodon lividus]